VAAVERQSELGKHAGGLRLSAVSAPRWRFCRRTTEKRVVIIEAKKEKTVEQFADTKPEVTQAISNLHNLSVADHVLVVPGSIPIPTSGKVRRSVSALPARLVHPVGPLTDALSAADHRRPGGRFCR
jgi:acyl-CoA synthetase (AMP-forming)/AMP-acid ligase II